jgi:hypothetical protein
VECGGGYGVRSAVRENDREITQKMKTNEEMQNKEEIRVMIKRQVSN